MSNARTNKPGSNRTENLLARFRNGIGRYWFVAIPAIALNIGVTLDHVIAKNNENLFRVSLNAAAAEMNSEQDDEAPLNQSLRAHWVTADSDGTISGRISAIEPNESTAVPIERLTVTLLQQGIAIHKSSTDDDGKFQLENVEPGVFTLVAAGRNGFLAYGIHVLPRLEEFNILESGNTQLDPKSRRAFYVSHFEVPPTATIADELQIDAAAIPPEFNTLQRISQNYLASASAFSIGRDQDDRKAIDKANIVKGGFKYSLSPEGSFFGRIQPIATKEGKQAKLSEMNIFLIQDDVEMARVAVKENGEFEIEEVDPGVYSVVAAGEDGFAALALELTESKTDDQQGSMKGNDKFYVSNKLPAPQQTLGIAIVTDPRDIRAIRNELTRVVNLNQPVGQALNQPFVNQGQYVGPGIEGQVIYQSPIVYQSPLGAPFPSNFFPGVPAGQSFAPSFQTAPAFTGPRIALPRLGVSSSPGSGRLILGALLIGLGVEQLSDDSNSINDPIPASPARIQ